MTERYPKENKDHLVAALLELRRVTEMMSHVRDPTLNTARGKL